jgi:hypothetical protein
MRFPSGMEASDIQVELKYCERCGGLWLRPQGSAGVYCEGCCTCLAELADRMNSPHQDSPRKVLRRRASLRVGKGKRGGGDASSARIESLDGVATMEVGL